MKRFALAKIFLLIGALVVAGCDAKPSAEPPAPAQETTNGGWRVDKAASRIEFIGEQTGAAFTGTFADYDAAITLDTDDLGAATIAITINTASAKTGDRQRDAALPTSDWFSVKAFPTATFSSSDIESTGAGTYEARGTLTVRDTSRDLVLPFTLAIEGARAVAVGETTLDRSDFGVGQGEFATGQWVALGVTVRFHLEATR